jgi:hypothetical protein
MKKVNENVGEDETTASEEKEKKRPFTGCGIREDLIDWATKLKALGQVWGALSWHENQGDGVTVTLEACGEALGSIVMDYAELIETAAQEDERRVFPFEWHEEVLEWIADSEGGGGSAGVITVHQRLIDDFIRTVATPAFSLKNRFDEMKKKYPVKPEQEAFDPAAEPEAGLAKRIKWLEKHRQYSTTGS